MFGPFKKNAEKDEKEFEKEEQGDTMSSEEGGMSHESESFETNKDSEVHTSDVEINQDQNEACLAELAHTKDQLVRLGADFQNYKKRVEKDRSQWMHMIQSDLMVDLLPIIDDFDRALDEADKKEVDESVAQWMQGFKMIHKAFYDYLKKQDIAPIEQVTTFDPELHEALMHVESENHQEGDIVQVLQRGFTLKGKVIRPAKVSVCK
ncbi:nucleotide exchange factor GrpE [Candidatus Babeliales bacterium]|nr:nucleotide exchange factor GrpE [Candidatus Babeliales bacterium]